jgi:mannose-binding lectin 2
MPAPWWLLGTAALAAAATVLPDHSFKPPYVTFSADGAREVGPTWKRGGTTEVLSNFVRLTPDRQAKRGWIKNTKAIERDSWSATLRFRISGQGKVRALALRSPRPHVDASSAVRPSR